MKKKLDTDIITNELKGQSLYFEDQSERLAQKAIDNETADDNETTQPTSSKETSQSKETANARTSERTNGRTNERANERTDEHMNARTDERVNEQMRVRPKEQKHKQSNEQKHRNITEETDDPVTINMNLRKPDLLGEDNIIPNPDYPNKPADEMPLATSRRPPVVKRIIKRHSFQFYVDQIEDLKRLQANFQFQGQDIQLSELVRDAVSEYLDRAYEPPIEPMQAIPNLRTHERTNE